MYAATLEEVNEFFEKITATTSTTSQQLLNRRMISVRVTKRVQSRAP
jgi:hypothetical protein